MTRSKRAHLPVTFPPLTPEDREAIERTASILNVSVDQLMSGPQAGQAMTPYRRRQKSPMATQHVMDLGLDDENDTTDNDQGDANDTRDSASEGDVTPWHSSAAEFDNIDDDVFREYEKVDLWEEDFPILSPATAPAQTPIPGSNTRVEPLAAYGYQIQSPWTYPQVDVQYYVPYPSPCAMGSLPTFGTTVATPGRLDNASLTPHQQAWEMIEPTQPTQPMQPIQPTQHAHSSTQVPSSQQTYDYAVLEPSTGAAKPHPSSRGGDVPSDELHFVSVDPLRPETTSRPQRRGPFEDREREETSRTRGLKACVRCRMQKIRCSIREDNPAGVCGTCMDVSKQKVHHLPCLRHRITECTLYRTGKAPGLEFTFRWPVMKLKEISEWDSPDSRTIHVRSDVCEVSLKLVVRKFKPIPDKDSIHRSWVDSRTGKKKFKKTTPYAIVNMKNAVHDMREYVTANVFKCMEYFLRGSDQLVKETYEFARRYMQRVESDEERKLLGNFFRLWFAIRRTATLEHIVGDDTLDMEPETADTSYPLFGKVPLPPVMIQQLDMVLTLGILEPLRKQVLEDFQKLVLATKNPRNWMTIYLVTFLSLHSCAKITEENYVNGRKHGLLRRYAMPNFISDRHHSANVFLSHYHYRTESSNPFNQDWKRRHMSPFSYMSVDDIQFLERTKVLLKEREDIIKTNRENDLYEHELYFVSQMFEDNWQPRNTIIDYTEGTVNDVGLKKYAGDGAGEKG